MSQLWTFAFTPSPETVWKRSGPSGLGVSDTTGPLDAGWDADSRRTSAGLPEHAVISAMHPAIPAAAKRLTALIRVPFFPFTAID
ncbi:hypothetical protein NicSoilB8_44470 [Arthrobacter sp. NicSoilB8]|nr:hypothetical protein NicSoilB8_44470 [Arthrobacter sp. NicSoilB8]